MILRFHAADAQPGEHSCLNICTDPENYNFDDLRGDQFKRYIEVSRDDLGRIYAECDFNCFWYSADLLAPHDAGKGAAV